MCLLPRRNCRHFFPERSTFRGLALNFWMTYLHKQNRTDFWAMRLSGCRASEINLMLIYDVSFQINIHWNLSRGTPFPELAFLIHPQRKGKCWLIILNLQHSEIVCIAQRRQTTRRESARSIRTTDWQDGCDSSAEAAIWGFLQSLQEHDCENRSGEALWWDVSQYLNSTTDAYALEDISSLT